MFEKYKQRRKIQDEIIEKLVAKLEETNNWTKEPDVDYRYKDTDLIVRWGRVYHYESSTKHRSICNPDYMQIPRRYRKQIQTYITKIDNRDDHGDTLSFLNDYLSGEYRYKVKFDTNKKSEMSIWLQEEDIFDYYVNGETIWFKNESDAVGFKLRWVEHD